MKYRRLGKTNLRVSVVGLGTWQFGGEWGKEFHQDEVDAMFVAAREEGINLIDTAECYGNHTSETLIGKAIQHDRAKWIIATKFGHKFHSHMNRTDHRGPRDVVEQLEESLRCLKTDYVDLLQYHSFQDAQVENDALSDAIYGLMKSGKVRHLGNSIGSAANNVAQVTKATSRKVEAIQVIYNRLDRIPEKEVLPLCQQQDLGVLARVPLASGYLSGKYQPGAKFIQTDVRSGRDAKEQRENLEEVQKIQREELPAGVPMAQWALAWCLQNPAVTCVIPGVKDVQQVRDNAAAAKLALVRDDHPQAK